MTAAQVATKVLARLATIDGIDVVDGGVLRTPQRPYLAFFAGIAVRTEQRYGDATPRRTYSYSVMVVNNTAQGCRILADRVTTLLDDRSRPGFYGDGVLSVADYSSDLVVDDEVEGAWRYSITCQFQATEES